MDEKWLDVGLEVARMEGPMSAMMVSQDGSVRWNVAFNPIGAQEASPAKVQKHLSRVPEMLKTYPKYPLQSARGQIFTTTGVDPEMFIGDAAGNLIPAFNVLPDKKRAKVEADDLGTKTFGYWDGFQAEISVASGGCHEGLVGRIRGGIYGILQAARRTHPGARILPKTVVRVPDEILATAAEEHVALGCKPSFNVYGMEGMIVDDPRALKHRFAGGHVHMGFAPWWGLTPAKVDKIVRAADLVVGIPSIMMFQKLDDPIRRRHYGLPGEHRLPQWGVEYRFLSNAWMFHPAIAHLTLGLARAGMRIGYADLLGCFDADGDRVRQVLWKGDLDEAKRIVERNEELFKAILETNMYGPAARVAALKQIVSPIQEFVDVVDVEKNWEMCWSWTTWNNRVKPSSNAPTVVG